MQSVLLRYILIYMFLYASLNRTTESENHVIHFNSGDMSAATEACTMHPPTTDAAIPLSHQSLPIDQAV